MARYVDGRIEVAFAIDNNRRESCISNDKSGVIRYLFGLATPSDSILPGSTLGGRLPLLVLSTLFLVSSIVVNTV